MVLVNHQRCDYIVRKFSEKNWYHRYFSHNSDDKAFEEIRKRLNDARVSLQLSLAVEQTKTLSSWKIAQETDQSWKIAQEMDQRQMELGQKIFGVVFKIKSVLYSGQ